MVNYKGSIKNITTKMNHAKYFINIQNLALQLKNGIQQLIGEYPISFKKESDSIEICFFQDNEFAKRGGLKIFKTVEKIIINYGRKIDVFRALGYVFSDKNKLNIQLEFVEIPKFDMVGVMLDSSRNGVMTVDNVKTFLRCCALMGV